MVLSSEAGAQRRGLLKAGDAAYRRGDPQSAAVAYRAALAADPEDLAVRYNLAASLLDADLVEQARAELDTLCRATPDDARVWAKLAELEERCGDHRGAIRAYDAAIARDPEFAHARLNRGIALLRLGDRRGWDDYEWRWRTGAVAYPRSGLPDWDGGRLDGELLVVAEQGLGDILQFARFVRPARTRTAGVVFLVPAALAGLLREWLPDVAVIAPGEPLPPAHRLRAQVALLSLPGLLGFAPTGADTAALLPPPVPARDRRGARLLVGVNWAGNPRYGHDRHRSCTLDDLIALADLPSISLCSLQFRASDEDRERLRREASRIDDLSGGLEGFIATARTIRTLDVVVTIDSVVGHLSASLGIPTFLLLSCACDWRWQLEGQATAWYPAMRLFRQRQRGDWSGVVADVRLALAALRQGACG